MKHGVTIKKNQVWEHLDTKQRISVYRKGRSDRFWVVIVAGANPIKASRHLDERDIRRHYKLIK